MSIYDTSAASVLVCFVLLPVDLGGGREADRYIEKKNIYISPARGVMTVRYTQGECCGTMPAFLRGRDRRRGFV